MVLTGEALLEGSGAGPVLRLDAPISFWGGVDPATGRVTDPRHPAHGRAIGGTVLAIAALRGSSSSSAVMLELIHRGLAPAAILLAEPDGILVLGAIVAREMGWPAPPMLRLADLSALPDGAPARVEARAGDGARVLLG